jgi:transposase
MSAASLVSDDLWEARESLLPKDPHRPKGGRPRVPNRAALGGIIFVLRTGCPWRLLPMELGCGSGTTCWRRLRDWQEAGVWEKLHTKLRNWLGGEAAIDWSRTSMDSLSVRAKRGASKRGETRPTAASLAPSTTLGWIATASHSASVSPRPTSTIPPNSCRWSMPSRPSSDREENQAGLASVLPSCTRTKRMTPGTCGGRYVFVASPFGSPAAAPTPASGRDETGGWWSARSPGCWAVAG